MVKSGQKFGNLTMVSKAPSKGGNTYWSVICNCGQERDYRLSRILDGSVTSCGCGNKAAANPSATNPNPSATIKSVMGLTAPVTDLDGFLTDFDGSRDKLIHSLATWAKSQGWNPPKAAPKPVEVRPRTETNPFWIARQAAKDYKEANRPTFDAAVETLRQSYSIDFEYRTPELHEMLKGALKRASEYITNSHPEHTSPDKETLYKILDPYPLSKWLVDPRKPAPPSIRLTPERVVFAVGSGQPNALKDLFDPYPPEEVRAVIDSQMAISQEILKKPHQDRQQKDKTHVTIWVRVAGFLALETKYWAMDPDIHTFPRIASEIAFGLKYWDGAPETAETPYVEGL